MTSSLEFRWILTLLIVFFMVYSPDQPIHVNTHKVSSEALEEVSEALVQPGVGPGVGPHLVAEPLVRVLVRDDAADALQRGGGRHAFLD